jgi:signal peptidase I
MNGERRGAAARLGIAALNLLLPGLGLLRIGEGKRGATYIAVVVGLTLGLIGAYALAPPLSFRPWIVLTAGTVILYIATMLAAIVASLRRSGHKAAHGQWWSRWYGIAGIAAAVSVATLAGPAPTDFYHSYYLRSESMMPTFARGDRFIARMGDVGPLARGQVILVRAQRGATYVERVVALPGDRIAMAGGIVVLNGRPVPQRLVRTEHAEFGMPAGEVQRLAEHLPGEAREHEIYDLGLTPVDDFLETMVQPGHVFVLGDNRDMSADSRVPRADMGLEQVPVAAVIGRPLFFSWWPGQRRAGEALPN